MELDLETERFAHGGVTGRRAARFVPLGRLMGVAGHRAAELQVHASLAIPFDCQQQWVDARHSCARSKRAARHFRHSAQRCNGLGSGPL